MKKTWSKNKPGNNVTNILLVDVFSDTEDYGERIRKRQKFNVENNSKYVRP